MSKDLHNNERYLKERADTYKPVPPPLVWDEIEQVLDKDKPKKRLFPILWIFGIVVLGAILFFNLSGNKDKESSLVEQETIINDSQKQSDPNPQNITSVGTGTSSEVNQTQNQNANASETIRTVAEHQEAVKVDSEKLKSFETPQQQLNNLKSSGVGRSLNTNIKRSEDPESNEVSPAVPREANTKANISANINSNSNSINSNPTAIITQEDIFRPKMSTPSTLEDMNSTQLTLLPRLKSRSSPLVYKIPLPDLSENRTAVPILESKSNPLSSSPWFVELGGGIGKNLSNPELINPLQGGYRLATESSWYSWSTSFQFGVQFDNLWYTTIGFDLNQTKYKFDFWRRNISNLIVSENQNFRITNSDFFNIGEISYTFADIGLSIGRRVNINKWHFSLEGGAIYNVLFNANGKVQVGDLEFSRLEDQEEYFNTQIGFGARLSAMLDYPIADQLWISVGPTYHQYFNTVSSGENPLKEQNSILQVKAKVRCHF